jgi:hypothetical protein
VVALIEYLNKLAAEGRENPSLNGLEWSVSAIEQVIGRAEKILSEDPLTAVEFTVRAIRAARRRRSEAAPPELFMLRVVRGRAWVIHANALRRLGRWRHSQAALRRAAALFAVDEALAIDRAVALLEQARLWADLQHFEAALDLTRECADTFADHADADLKAEADALEEQLRQRTPPVWCCADT